jgi:hypothetical protein
MIVPIDLVDIDPKQVWDRDVKRYVATDTQRWYATPLTCIKRASGRFECNGLYTHSQAEACRQLGYTTLQICYVEV